VSGVLVLSGHEALLVVDDDVVGEHVAKRGRALVDHARLPELCLWMLWCHVDAELVHLLVTYTDHPSPGDQEVPVPVLRANKAECAVTDRP
jgi:hypothetical protein